MKAKIFYVGGNTYTLGGVVDYDVIASTVFLENEKEIVRRELVVTTKNVREGCLVDSTVTIDLSQTYYVQVTGDSGEIHIIPGVMNKFNVKPTIDEQDRITSIEREEKRLVRVRAERKEKNRIRLDKKRATRYDKN